MLFRSLTSFVPKGRKDLAAGNSVLFPIKEEKVEEQGKVSSGEENNVSGEIKTEEIVSSFDRNIEPPVGPDPVLKVPPVWSGELSNGIKIYGIEYKELPLVQFAITVKGGMLMDDPDKIGVANLITDEMMQGTRNKTPIELEEAIDDLGATINMYTTKQSIVIEASCLASKFEDTYKLVEEILFEPRWDKKEFDRVKNETIESIKRKKVDPGSVAASVFNKLIYGENNIIANDTYGTVESVQAITVDDLKNYYENNFAPRLAFITIAGEVPEDNAVKLFRSLENKWQKKDVQLPGINVPEKPEHPSIYFVDFPNAKQSAIRIGTLGLKYTDPDYYKAVVMNYKLGGSFNGRVNMILREEKGYTYGARTSFSAALYPGTFVALSNVRTNTTFESVKIFMDELNKYRQGISEEDLQFTKNALIKSNARRFETLGALRGMLNNIALYNLPFDYVKEQENIIKNMTLDEHKAIAQKYIQPDRMIYVIAGDAKTQMDKLKNLGIGTPVLLDREGNPVK